LEPFPSTRLVYEQAVAASLPRQRNQGIEQARADIVFLFDDDSFMHPECARNILEVYFADKAGKILGVCAEGTGHPPDDSDVAAQIKQDAPSADVDLSGSSILAQLKRLVWKEVLLMGPEKFFVPYDGRYPNHEATPLPSQSEREHIFPGYCMTFRRTVFDKERFDDQMMRYASGEDLDLSYRVSRHGTLVRSTLAKVYHHTSATGRLKRFQVTALATLNQAYWIGKHGSNRAKAMFRHRVARRLIAESIKDAYQRRLDFPQLRGALFAARHVKRLLNLADDQRVELHSELQRQLFES
jgi:GT2 family glycosyltransferase